MTLCRNEEGRSIIPSNLLDTTRKRIHFLLYQSNKRKQQISVGFQFIHSKWMTMNRKPKRDFLSNYGETVAIYSKDLIRWIAIAAQIKIAEKNISLKFVDDADKSMTSLKVDNVFKYWIKRHVSNSFEIAETKRVPKIRFSIIGSFKRRVSCSACRLPVLYLNKAMILYASTF